MRVVPGLVTAAVLVAGGLASAHLLGNDEARDAPWVTDPVTAESQPLDLSGSGVGDHAFGTDADEVRTALTTAWGEPDLTVGPQRYVRIPGHEGWFEDAGDPISLSWEYPVASVSCWQVLCVVMGGQDEKTLQLRGWELAQQRRWSDFEELADPGSPAVRLAETGIRLGDSWTHLHEAYPDTVVQGAEGASLAVGTTPWVGISDGAGVWRLSGTWDHTRPHTAPDDAVVTRLSAGEGPQPGCC